MDTRQSHNLKPVETEDGSYTLLSGQFGATYHATQGAMEESKHVFINNGLLPFMRDHAKEELRILEVGFGSGLNTFLTFLKTKNSGVFVDYYAVELYPVPMEIAKQLNFTKEYSLEEEATFLRMHEQVWNETAKLTETFFLTKQLKNIEAFYSEQKFDLIYFDAFSPREQPELWTEAVFQNMFSLLNKHGRLVTYCAQGQMKRNMKSAGFKVKSLKGFAAKREMTVGEK